MNSPTAAGQRGFRHELLLHRSAAELLDFVLPVVRDGVAAEEPTLLLVRPDTGATVLRSVGPSPLWVPENRRTSCDLLIFVDEAAEAVVSLDLVDLGCSATGEWS